MSTITTLLAQLASRCPIRSDMTSVNAIMQCRENWSLASVVNHTVVTDRTIWQPGFNLPHHTWSLLNHFRIGQGHAVLTCTNGSRPISFLWLWPVTDYEPHCRHVPINKIWRWTESTPQSGWWCSQMAGIYRDCSTREIKNKWVHCTNRPPLSTWRHS